MLKWSNFGTQKTPLVYQGGKYGDVFLKVIDDFERGRVRLEVLNARDVKECEFDAVGNIKRIVIEYPRVEKDASGKEEVYIYREVIDQEWHRTYKGDHMFAYHRGYYTDPITNLTDMRPLAQWPNPYGFVPVRHIPHMKGAGDWGMTSFQMSLGKINELNDAASMLQDSVRKAIDPIWALIGGRMPSGSKKDENAEKDEVAVINIPVGGDIKALVTPVDITGALAAINQIIGEIERDMPQLSLQRIRESGGNPSGVAIENSYSDASDLLVEVQGNYDQGLTAAIQMCLSIGALRYPTNRTAYAAFAGYDPVKSYEDGTFDFYLKQRDVFSDRVSLDRRIELLNQSANLDTLPVVARDLGYSEDDVALMVDSRMIREEQAIAAGIRAAAQAAGMDTDEEEEEDVIEEEAQA